MTPAQWWIDFLFAAPGLATFLLMVWAVWRAERTGRKMDKLYHDLENGELDNGEKS